MTLQEHIASSRMSALAWANEKGIAKDAVYRHLQGKPVSYETAECLSGATGGKVAAIAIYRTGRPKK